MPQPRSSGYFRTTYSQDMGLLQTRGQHGATIAGLLIAGAFPFVASPFMLDLGNQVLIAVVGAVALMLLTGYAGQVSLGHAGLMAAGAFTTGILARETGAPFWITLPAAGLMGAVIGFVFGLPSLRLRGLYLAVSTLALHFIVIHAGQEYETRRGLSSGVVIEPWMTDQWFVDAATLAKPAIEAVESGRTKFVPQQWTNTYYEWMRNIQPWCVSRQLWWGHQIPEIGRAHV